MTSEYLRKVGSFVKWLVPFALAIFLLFGCGSPQQTALPTAGSAQSVQNTQNIQNTQSEQTEAASSEAELPNIDGSYSSKDEVALYLHMYEKLPSNYITKKQAEKAGWISKEGNLWDVAPGKSIGGDRFGNYEEQLPDEEGRKWKECDIDFDGTYRNAKRIIYSNDGLIYYTEDHYKTFEQLY